ncbi:MAG TPA: hypothetical protein PLE54_11095 [Burkholderiaceae bacterium]|nr:hypothetical protein [Burkholderiaceae bacterium]HQR71141.1 hypothetical protein [Burkholderiaceae bacterium]
MGLRLLKVAVIYLFLGALLGLAMGISGKFTLAPVHAHLALAGWATLAIAGLIYHCYPAASTTRLARWHFWLHNIGLPVFMAGLALLLNGVDAAFPLTAGGASALLVGFALFALNVLLNIRAGSAGT